METPLHHSHLDLKAKMIEFAGWSMPIVYSSIIEEHLWTRKNISIFDVSHMGRLELTGASAPETLDYLCTRKMTNLSPEKSRYALMCNAEGGILDDLIVSRLSDEKFYVVCNASNRDKIFRQIENHLEPGDTLIDRTLETAMVAIQGPKVAALMSKFLPDTITRLPHRGVQADKIMGIDYLAFRGGYTGEDGFEVVLPANFAPLLWMQLIDVSLDGEKLVKPAGLGSRDTLRLEAGLPLYGHELSESIDPISANLEFAVDFEHDYIGKESLEKIKKTGPKQRLVGLKLSTRRTARQGFRILQESNEIGTITSGAFAPFLNQSIAMGYVESSFDKSGEIVSVDFGSEILSAEITPLPFYRREKPGKKTAES
jgi:aminomethyltransferase